ncbi:amidohydrolase family protein [Streptomyces sp. MBT65]|nr:amidohydrolase family protein [Streptomyces sp. MBT65]
MPGWPTTSRRRDRPAPRPVPRPGRGRAAGSAPGSRGVAPRRDGPGLCDALVNDHALGHYLDEPRYLPFWEALQELGVPLYLHTAPWGGVSAGRPVAGGARCGAATVPGPPRPVRAGRRGRWARRP